MTFDPFASIAIICVLLIILLIWQAIMTSKTLAGKDKVQDELINKLMARDYKDYSEGTHRIDMGIAAMNAAARTPKPKPKPERNEDLSENLDEVPIT